MTGRGRPPLLIIMACLAIAGCLVTIISGLSLQRADSLGSVIGAIASVGALIAALFGLSSASSTTTKPGADAQASSRDRPEATRPAAGVENLLITLALVVVLCTIGFVIVHLIIDDKEPVESASPSETTTSARPDIAPPSTTAAPTVTNADAGAQGAQLTAAPSTTSAPACPTAELPQSSTAASTSTEPVRRLGTLSLTPRFGADLDSRCLDWEIGLAGSTALDLSNNGIGLAAGLDSTIATVEPSASPSFSYCAANTVYLTTTITYSELTPGSRYCVLTSKGRRSVVEVGSVTPFGRDGFRIDLQVTTWEQAQNDGDDSWVVLVLLVIALMAAGSAKAANQKGNSRPVSQPPGRTGHQRDDPRVRRPAGARAQQTKSGRAVR